LPRQRVARGFGALLFIDIAEYDESAPENAIAVSHRSSNHANPDQGAVAGKIPVFSMLDLAGTQRPRQRIFMAFHAPPVGVIGLPFAILLDGLTGM
jgi:hypothetical protein